MGLFVAHELGLELVRALGRVLPRIARKDKDLARQLRRSAASVVLNLAEGTHSDPGNREARYATAAGSAKETQSALIIAEAWGYTADPALTELADRVAAITYRLAHGRAGPHRDPDPGLALGPRPRPPGPGHSDSEPVPDSDPDPDSAPS
jgi:four helix bundle protein